MGKGELSAVAKIYLAFYNLLQFAGWGYCLIIFWSFVVRKGHYQGVWSEVELPLTIFQTLQLIEVLHCVVGLVPSSAFQTFIQILSRLVVVWGVLLSVPEARSSVGLPLLLGAWSLAEVTRYLYYALNIFNAVPYLLTWARYSFFIVLYPTGVTGELLTMVTAFPYLRDRQLYSLPLPNVLNFSFYFHLALIGIMLSYIPFFPQLYFYMVRQRKKVLGGPKPKNS